MCTCIQMCVVVQNVFQNHLAKLASKVYHVNVNNITRRGISSIVRSNFLFMNELPTPFPVFC